MPYFPVALISFVYSLPEQNSLKSWPSLLFQCRSHLSPEITLLKINKDLCSATKVYHDFAFFFSVEIASSLSFYFFTLTWFFSHPTGYSFFIYPSLAPPALQLVLRKWKCLQAQILSPHLFCLQTLPRQLVTWIYTPSRGSSHFILATPTWKPGTKLLTGRRLPIISNRKTL